MNFKHEGDRLIVTGTTELSGLNSGTFRDEVRAALGSQATRLDLDFSKLAFLDSSGLGALISLHKTLAARGGAVRILNPTPGSLQLLELTRLHLIFEVVKE